MSDRAGSSVPSGPGRPGPSHSSADLHKRPSLSSLGTSTAWACGLLATIFTGALIPHCSNQSYTRGMLEGEKAASAEVQDLKKANADLQGTLNNDKGIIANLDAQIRALQGEMRGVQEQHKVLADEHVQIKSQLQACLDGRPEGETIAQLQQQVAQQSAVLRQAEADAGELGARVESLQTEARRLTGEVGTLKGQLSAVSAERDQLRIDAEKGRADLARLARIETELAAITLERDTLKSKLQSAAAAASKPQEPQLEGTSPSPEAPMIAERGGARFELVGLKLDGGTILAELRITPGRDGPVALNASGSRIFDSQSREFRGDSCQLGDRSGSPSVSVRAVAGIVITGRMRFASPPSDVTVLPVVSIDHNLGNNIEFRNVRVAR